MRMTQLKTIADIQTGPFGSQLHKEDYVETGTPIVTVEHLGNRVFTEQNLPRVSDSDKARLIKYTLSTGDIVFSRVGSVDRCSYVDKSHDGWMFSGRCLRVRPTELVDSLYLYYYFCLEETKQFVRNIAVGATMPSINTKLLGEVEIALPDLNNQKRIAAVLSSLDDKIENNQKLNDNLEATAMAIFKAHFVTFEQYEGSMPTNWKKATIGDVVTVTRGASPRPIQDYMSETGVPWVKISDASASVSKYLFSTAECIIPEGVSSSRTVLPGMMIVSNSASPGLPMIMEITACVHDGWLIIDDYKGVTQEYMYYHFLNERHGLVSSSNGSVFNNLKTDIVKAHPVIIPDEDTMTAISQQFCSLNHSIKQNAQEIIALNELRNSLLSQLSGN